jgi:methylated-DNA-[protein]-cysteine S-methyltransferase
LPLKFIGTEFQKAVKAVGSTNGKNPLSIFVPCHRVVDSSGKLTGYAGGLEKKEFLLDLEKIHIAD